MEVIKQYLIYSGYYFKDVVFSNLFLDIEGRYYLSIRNEPCKLIDFEHAENLIKQTKGYFEEV